MQNQIIRTLRSLGITANYRGYRQLCVAISLVVENEDRMLHVAQEVYNPTADTLHCNRKTIERNIRTIIRRIWSIDPSRYLALSGTSISEPPTASEFIDVLAYHVRCICTTHKH